MELPPRHPFLPPPSLVSSELSLLQQMRSHVGAMSHWWHVLWLLPLSVLVALGLLRLVVPWLRSSGAMRRAVEGCLELGQLLQDSSEVLARTWRYQRGHLGWSTELNDLRERTCQQLQDLAQACMDRTIRPAFDRCSPLFDRHLRPLFHSLVQQATLVWIKTALAYYRLSSSFRSLLLERVIPAWEAGKSHLDRAFTAYLFPMLDSLSEALVHLQESGRAALEATKSHGSACARLVEQLALDLLETLNDLSRTVTAAFFAFTTSPSPPVPFHYSPLPAPSPTRAPSRGRSRLRVEAEEEELKEAAEQRMLIRSLQQQEEPELLLEAEVGFGTPHQRQSAQVWSEQVGVERFQQMIELSNRGDTTDEGKQLQPPRLQLVQQRAQVEQLQVGEQKQREPTSATQPLQPPLHMRIWREAEEKQATRPRINPLAYLIVQPKHKAELD